MTCVGGAGLRRAGGLDRGWSQQGGQGPHFPCLSPCQVLGRCWVAAVSPWAGFLWCPEQDSRDESSRVAGSSGSRGPHFAAFACCVALAPLYLSGLFSNC